MSRRWRSIFSVLLAGALIAGLVPSAGAAPGKPKKPAVETDKAATRAEARSGGVINPNAKAAVRMPRDAKFVPGEVIVRFKPSATASAKRLANAKAGAVTSKRLGTIVPGLTKVKLKKGMSVEGAIAAYEKQADVEYAQPNYIKRIAATPNDPKYSELWGLNNTGQTGGTADADIDAPEAWDITTGSNNIVIAVIDTGVDYTHPDLAPNMWTNPDEIPGNGIDDDGNGYVDDVHGIDTAYGDSDPMDGEGHGTHVAGTIGGQGNDGDGVVGVNWDVKIMAIKMLDDYGSGTTESALEAFQYVKNNEAKFSSNSWGGNYPFDQAEYDAIKAIDKLFVFAAGNGGDDFVGDSTDVSPHYPSAYNLANILSVGATDHNDAKAGFSNYGPTTVDVFAPGVDTLSTVPVKRRFAPQVASTLFADSMSNFNNWDLGTENDEVSQPWTISTEASVSAPSSAANVGYTDDQWDWIRLKTGLDLSAGDPVYLNAKVRYDLEPEFDFLEVWGYSPARGWVLLDELTGDSGDQFEDLWVDASPFAGQTGVVFTFDLASDMSISSLDGYEGVYVDDVRVVTAQSTVVSTDDMSTDAAWMKEQQTKPWALSASRYVSAPYSLAHTYYNNSELALAKQTVGVQPTAGKAFMRYKVWHSTQAGYDWFGPISDRGAGPWVWAGPRTSGSTGGWVTRSTPAYGGYTNSKVKFGFGFQSNSSQNGYEGVYVDDVEFRSLTGSWVSDSVKAYGSNSGTSMATPHVAGVAGLMCAVRPTATAAQLKSMIISTVDKKPALASYCVSGGRVNARAAVEAAGKGIVKGSVKWNGKPVGMVSVRVDSTPAAYTTSSGAYSVGGLSTGSHTVTASKRGYVTKTVYGVNTPFGGTATVNTNLVARPVIYRSPTSSKLTYKRKRGVAKFKLTGKFKISDGWLFTGRRVYLQSSRTGTGGWKNTYALTTNSYGNATKSFKVKKASTRYYRWYIPGSGVNTAAYGAKQKVIVK